MNTNDKIQIFEDKRIRTAWDEEAEEWYFSVVDVVGILSESDNPRRYWSDLKRKLKAEGANEVYEKIVQLKMTAPLKPTYAKVIPANGLTNAYRQSRSERN